MVYGCASGEPLLLPAEKKISVEGFFLSEWLDQKGVSGRQEMISTLADMVRTVCSFVIVCYDDSFWNGLIRRDRVGGG